VVLGHHDSHQIVAPGSHSRRQQLADLARRALIAVMMFGFPGSMANIL
jgi:hypothetical protein